MIVKVICPTRISLFGGGSDVEPYASKYGGTCINMAINLYQHMTFDTGYPKERLLIPYGANPDFYRTIAKEMDYDLRYLKAWFDADIESGLGSSASAAVAMIAGINKIKGLNMSKYDIAMKAWDIEVNKLGLYGGKQDQFAAACGGLNKIEFRKLVYSQPIDDDGLLDHLLLFYTGMNRQSPKIQEGFKELSKDQKDALDGLKNIAEAIHSNTTWRMWGFALDASWDFKKDSNKGVINPRINSLHDIAMKACAWGGKVLGAGGGGHMAFMSPIDKREGIIKAMKNMGALHVDFDIDRNGVQARIL